MSFSIAFDPDKLEFLNADLASEQEGAMLMRSDRQSGQGRVGFLIAARPGGELEITAPQLLNVRFQVRASGDSGLEISDSPTPAKVSDTQSRALAVQTTSRSIRIESRVRGFGQWTQDVLAALEQGSMGETAVLLPEDLSLDADPDKDGLSNEWEYYLDLSPTEVDGNPLKTSVRTDSGGAAEAFAVQLEFRSDRMQGECVAEFTYDLSTWTPIDSSKEEDLGNARMRTTWQVSAMETEAYVRIRLVRP